MGDPWYVRHAPQDQEDPPAAPPPPDPPGRLPPCQQGHSRDDQACGAIPRLRIRQIHLGVFLRVNKATQEMIKRVEPYLAYGYPSLKATRALIYKRGFGKAKTKGQAQRLPLTDNKCIEDTLGQY